MEKIINGKRYSTETAEEIASYYSDIGSLDEVCEMLFRKRTGEYFVSGYGGARSRYAKRSESGGWKPGEAIIPLSDEKAREWLEAHADAETIARCFPVDDDGEAVRVGCIIPKEEAERLRAYARRSGKTVSEILRMAIARLE